MKLVKSLLLGSAVGIVAAAGAQAADLPTRKAAPVEYVRICDAYGAGFFYIPGTDTCLRIGGFVRAEYTWQNSRNIGVPTGGALAVTGEKSLDQTGFRARGRLQVDTRTQTAWGTLRAFGRFDYTRDTGVYAVTGTQRTSYLSVRYVFVQWAGITAGRAQSFFDFYADALNFERVRGSDTTTQLLAYTATFGGGFSATVSIEDRNERMSNGSGVIPVTVGGAGTVVYAGTRSPDFVGALRVDQSWGSAQLSGALHSLNTVAGTTTTSAVGAASKYSWGWAVQGGLMFNLPMLAAGDQLWLQAAYADGALDYIGVGTPNQGNVSGGYLGRFHGGLQRTDADAFATCVAAGCATGYSIEREKGWVGTVGFLHYWAPNFKQSVYGSYLEVRPGTAARSTSYLAGGLGRAREWTVGTTLTWSPVKDFDIGLDLVYSRLHQDLAGIAPPALPATVKKDVDTYQARLRFNRAF